MILPTQRDATQPMMEGSAADPEWKNDTAPLAEVLDCLADHPNVWQGGLASVARDGFVCSLKIGQQILGCRAEG